MVVVNNEYIDSVKQTNESCIDEINSKLKQTANIFNQVIPIHYASAFDLENTKL